MSSPTKANLIKLPHVRLIPIFVAIFITGLLVGYLGPQISSQLMPQKTIFDELNDAGIPFTRIDNDFNSHLSGAKIVSQITSFPRFTNDYSYTKANPFYASLHVFVDSWSKIVWIEGSENDGSVMFVWFYAYS